MDAIFEQQSLIEYSVSYKGTPFISRHEFSPNHNDWYYVLFLEDDMIFGCYCEFKDGKWIEGLGEVIYWQENM